MSAAVPCAPPHGWWIMMRLFGSEYRMPFVPAQRRIAPMDAAWPIQYVATGQRTNCMTS